MRGSVLDKIEKSDIIMDPFPHVIVEDCLDPDYYNELASCYPTREMLSKGYRKMGNTRPKKKTKYTNNIRIDLVTQEILDGTVKVPEIWRQFVKFHSSNKFHKAVLSLFREGIKKNYKSFSAKRLLQINCNIGCNTPVAKKSSVRTAHIDVGKYWYSGLLYMRDDEDDSTGGDLELYRFKSKPIFFGSKKRDINVKCLKAVKKVPYKKNMFVLFLNTVRSAHGVTTRSKTKHYRRMVVFNAKLRKTLF